MRGVTLVSEKNGEEQMWMKMTLVHKIFYL